MESAPDGRGSGDFAPVDGGAGGVGYVVANQLLDVINQLPSYKANIERKLESFHGPHAGSLAKATDSVQELSKELSTGTPKEQPAELPRHPTKTQQQRRPQTQSNLPRSNWLSLRPRR